MVALDFLKTANPRSLNISPRRTNRRTPFRLCSHPTRDARQTIQFGIVLRRNRGAAKEFPCEKKPNSAECRARAERQPNKKLVPPTRQFVDSRDAQTVGVSAAVGIVELSGRTERRNSSEWSLSGSGGGWGRDLELDLTKCDERSAKIEGFHILGATMRKDLGQSRNYWRDARECLGGIMVRLSKMINQPE
jgi:hypothetical protein